MMILYIILIVALCLNFSVFCRFLRQKQEQLERQKVEQLEAENMDVDRDTKHALKTLEHTLRAIPVNIKIFSRDMSSLFSNNVVVGNYEVSEKFQGLLDNVKNDAMVYLKVVLPFSMRSIATLSEYFEYYKALTYDEWCAVLPDILQKAKEYKNLAITNVEMHEKLIDTLKKKESEAKLIICEFQYLQNELDRKIKQLETKAEKKRIWGIRLGFVPVINIFATPILFSLCYKDFDEVLAKKKEVIVKEQAANVITSSLVPALKDFICGLEAAAGFFEVVEQKLGTFKRKAEKGVEKRKMGYFKVMNKEAKKMDRLCKSLSDVLQDVCFDFEAISVEGTDKSYVDRWHAEQKETLRKRRKLPKSNESNMKVITKK